MSDPNTKAIGFFVDERSCIRCGACCILAPGVFALGSGAATVHASAIDEESIHRATASLLICPTAAIKRRQITLPEPPDEIQAAKTLSNFSNMVSCSESVRWKYDEIRWHALDPNATTEPLRGLVRQMAFSEHATYSATQRFMQDFSDDVAFTQWLSIWFYEETRHPHVLTEWLTLLGDGPSPATDFVLEARVSTPFMKSKMGTLVTNIVSEVTASAAYTLLSQASREPVLAQLAKFIAADEARHAAAFFHFAKERLDNASDPLRDRLDALKVFGFWISQNEHVTHPINQMLLRLQNDKTGQAALDSISLDFDLLKRRLSRLIGELVGLDLQGPDDVLPWMKVLTSQVQARSTL